MTKWILHITFFSLLLSGGLLLGNDTLLYDESAVELRRFSQQKLEEYRGEVAFQYVKVESKTEWTWWDWFWYKVRRFLAGMTPGGKIFQNVIVWVLGILIVGLIVFALMKLPLRKLWDPSVKKLNVGFEELEENIHEIDFDELIAQAIQDKAYRRGVRLLYLETLKELTAHKWIDWRINKTNYDYQQELFQTPLEKDFDALTLDYEYVWYGDFPVNESGFNSMRKTFEQFQQVVKRT